MKLIQDVKLKAVVFFVPIFFLLMSVCNLALAQQSSTGKTLDLRVEVIDAAGNKVQGVAVSAVPKNRNLITPADTLGTMDQVDRQFAPHFLTVQKGTKVRFPNSDSIKHHVYSFSPAKRFELLLKRGSEEDPLLFDKTGIVELGCNVHDWMLGYIYIVDTPYFAHTNKQGLASIALPIGEFEVSIWHPRLQEDTNIPTQSLTLDADKSLVFTLKQDLLPSFEDYEEEDEFSDYD